jgi:hypothetical protein
VCTGYQRNHAFVMSKDMQGVDQSLTVPKASSSGDFTAALQGRSSRASPSSNSNDADAEDSGNTGIHVVHRPRRPRKHNPWISARKAAHLQGDITAYAQVADLHMGASSMVYEALTASPITFRGSVVLSPTAAPSSIPALRVQLLNFFLQNQLPDAMTPGSPGARKSWLHTLPAISDTSPALENAMLAVCTAKLGRMDANKDLMAKSFDLYTTALKELRLALKTEQGRMHDHTLAAVMTLTMYEFTECPERKVSGYFAHVDGAMELMRLRGPEAHAKGMPHCVFFGMRIHGCFRSLNTHQKCFLADPAWRVIPYTENPRGIYDDLMDVLLELPDALAENDKAESIEREGGGLLTATDEATRVKLLWHYLETIRLSWRMEYMLEDWFQRFEASLSGPLYHPELATMTSRTDDERTGKLFPVAFHFSAFILGHSMTLYWAASCMVRTALMLLYESLERNEEAIRASGEEAPCSCPSHSKADEGFPMADASNLIAISVSPTTTPYKVAHCLRHFSTRNLPPLHHRADPEPLAWKVCQSVEYFLQERMGMLGSSVILPALIIIRDMLDLMHGEFGRQKLWIAEMMGEIAKRGNGLAGYA